MAKLSVIVMFYFASLSSLTSPQNKFPFAGQARQLDGELENIRGKERQDGEWECIELGNKVNEGSLLQKCTVKRSGEVFPGEVLCYFCRLLQKRRELDAEKLGTKDQLEREIL